VIGNSQYSAPPPIVAANKGKVLWWWCFLLCLMASMNDVAKSTALSFIFTFLAPYAIQIEVLNYYVHIDLHKIFREKMCLVFG
jgi:hypothetical protein